MFYSLFLILLLAPQETSISEPMVDDAELDRQILSLPLLIPENLPQTPSVSKAETAPFTGRRFWGNVVGISPQGSEDKEITTRSERQTEPLLRAGVQILSGHTGPVETVAFSPDFRNLFSGGSDRQLILWDTFSGELIRKYRGHRTTVASIAVSKNGKNFVSCTSSDRRVLFWDINEETTPEEYPSPPFEPSTIAINSDAMQVIVGLMNGQISVYQKAVDSPAPRETTIKGHLLAINQVRFSPDEKSFLTCGNDQTVFVWNARTYKPIQTFRKHRGAVLCADFSPDGQEIVSAGTDKTALVWTVANGEIKHRLSGHVGDITAVAFSADGSEICTASRDRTIVLWDATTGEKKSVAPKRNSPILSAGWDKVNNSVAVGCINGTVEILASSVFISETSATEELDMSGDAPASLPGTDIQKRNALLDLPQGQIMFRIGQTSHYSDIGAISPNGFQFASVNTTRGEGTLWETDTGKVIRIFSVPQVISAARFHPIDSNFFLTGSKNGAIQYWNFTYESTTDFPLHESPVQSIVLTQDGKRLFSGFVDGTVILWDILAKRKLQTIQASTKKIRSLAVSPDGKYFAVGSEDKTVGLWTFDGTAEEGKENLYMEQKLAGHESGEISVVFSSDGTSLFSAASDGKAIQWEVASGKLLKEFKAHTGEIASIAVSPNGQYLLTGGKAEEFSLLWNVNDAQPKMILPFQGGPVTDVMFHPKNFNVITVGGRTPRYWNISGIQGR